MGQGLLRKVVSRIVGNGRRHTCTPSNTHNQNANTCTTYAQPMHYAPQPPQLSGPTQSMGSICPSPCYPNSPNSSAGTYTNNGLQGYSAIETKAEPVVKPKQQSVLVKKESVPIELPVVVPEVPKIEAQTTTPNKPINVIPDMAPSKNVEPENPTNITMPAPSKRDFGKKELPVDETIITTPEIALPMSKDNSSKHPPQVKIESPLLENKESSTLVVKPTIEKSKNKIQPHKSDIETSKLVIGNKSFSQDVKVSIVARVMTQLALKKMDVTSDEIQGHKEDAAALLDPSKSDAEKIESNALLLTQRRQMMYNQNNVTVPGFKNTDGTDLKIPMQVAEDYSKTMDLPELLKEVKSDDGKAPSNGANGDLYKSVRQQFVKDLAKGLQSGKIQCPPDLYDHIGELYGVNKEGKLNLHPAGFKEDKLQETIHSWLNSENFDYTFDP